MIANVLSRPCYLISDAARQSVKVTPKIGILPASSPAALIHVPAVCAPQPNHTKTRPRFRAVRFAGHPAFCTSTPLRSGARTCYSCQSAKVISAFFCLQLTRNRTPTSNGRVRFGKQNNYAAWGYPERSTNILNHKIHKNIKP